MAFIDDRKCANDSPASCVPLGLVRGDADEVPVASESIFGYRHVLGDAAGKLSSSFAFSMSRLISRWRSGRQRRSGLFGEQAVGVCRHRRICQRCH